ncbi:MAG: DUF885 domain-containing protein [Chloroflexota bacterium]|nr:DUF885 domain-containing protein [Chloroflexota bacterium]
MTVAEPSTSVNELADRFWDGYLERDPYVATVYGDDRFDDRLPDLGPNGRAAHETAYRETLREAEAIDERPLDVESGITRDLLMLVSRNQLEALELKQYQLAVNQMEGAQILPASFARYQRVDTPERAERLLVRYRGFPELIEQYIGTLEEGMADDRTSAIEPVKRVIDQVERMLAVAPAESPMVQQANTQDPAIRERLTEATERSIYPALRRLHAFLRDAYIAHARQVPGISATPDGEAAYELAIRISTTLPLTAREVHEFGLAELERLDAERQEIATRLGHADGSALDRALREDPENHTDRPERLVEICVDQTRRALAAALRFFGRLPAAECVVVPVEPYREREAPLAFYMPPPVDRTRPGHYYINTYQPAEKHIHQLASITFHEATPGHHFQLATAMEIEGLPRARRLGWFLAGNAYVEGWGLYCERLADEMGLYLDDRERVGMIDTQAFRAARLVVDSGLHAMQWDRDRAIRFMIERANLPPVDAAIEVDRYTVWPGQALAYKVGQREIERARAEIAQSLGDRFDLPTFHDEVLAHGSIPLTTLRRELPRWVESAIGAR